MSWDSGIWLKWTCWGGVVVMGLEQVPAVTKLPINCSSKTWACAMICLLAGGVPWLNSCAK